MDCFNSQAPLNNSECCGYWKYSFACMSGVASINLNQPQLNDLSSSKKCLMSLMHEYEPGTNKAIGQCPF